MLDYFWPPSRGVSCYIWTAGHVDFELPWTAGHVLDCFGLLQSSGGGLAEFAVASETMTVPRPPEVSAAEAAGLPTAALTQPAGVKLDGTGPKKHILITAASGGVGHYAVQLAKLGNMHVTATCSQPQFRKELRCRRGN
ncbi:hypothetical protein TEA_018731 [Camellia sinensis var. sinensis]|uniref:Alcohol dehydrogenase-like C-terminal domain-containing protein n=1 Tax=Camellia sinensis var. sinensis TaxID=542762 RepID=A0A4S4EL91_CAMSN|nr:hypothetical protein TEA_018731 [Camellia sinensis var. sinensis]